MAEFTVLHRNEFERSGRWLLARRSLGLESFGMNLVELEPEGSIPEHDELERHQEEIFVVLEGDVAIVIDGTEHPAPAGTFGRLDPRPLRTVVNKGDEPALVLIASAPTTSGYEPQGWN
jgi:glyoxylate utilization-related uncharacterized protein